MRLDVEVGLVWGLAVKARMRPPGIVEAEIAADNEGASGAFHDFYCSSPDEGMVLAVPQAPDARTRQ